MANVQAKHPDRSAQSRLLAPLAYVTAIGMFIVLVMGATVTNTGSETGCGRSWPLCQGRLIPEFAMRTLIEFSHRFVVGIETILILALAVGAWRTFPRNGALKVLVGLMVGFLFLQAGMGAWAVMAPQASAVLALHFGISLVSVASTALVAAFIAEGEQGQALLHRGVSSAFTRAVWGTLVFTIVDVYVGAYIRHTGLNMGCRGWPLCNGAVIPVLNGPAGIVFAHRLGALALTAALVALLVWSWQLRHDRPDLLRGSIASLILVGVQALTGAMVAETGMNLWSALLHAGTTGILFTSLCYVGYHALPFPVAQPEAATPEVVKHQVSTA